jgi:hypothetical protein
MTVKVHVCIKGRTCCPISGQQAQRNLKVVSWKDKQEIYVFTNIHASQLKELSEMNMGIT